VTRKKQQEASKTNLFILLPINESLSVPNGSQLQLQIPVTITLAGAAIAVEIPVQATAAVVPTIVDQ
jgi:hypothetical protein